MNGIVKFQVLKFNPARQSRSRARLSRLLSYIVVLLILAMSLPAGASTTEKADKRELISRMLVLSGGFDIGLESVGDMLSHLKPMFEKLIPGKGDQAVQILREEVTEAMRGMQNEIEEDIIDIYARHFTLSELREMIDFYSTPVGMKSLQSLPAIMQESQKIGAKYGQRAQKIAGPRVEERLNALRSKSN